MPKRICLACNELKPHYSHKLCYLCYRDNQCRWLYNVDRWAVETLEKPQCQNLMQPGCMGFCKKHWKYIQQQQRQRGFQRNPMSDMRRQAMRDRIQQYLIHNRPSTTRVPRKSTLLHEEIIPVDKLAPLVLRQWVGSDGTIYFSGSPTGIHTLTLAHSPPERVASHWEGYVESAIRSADPLYWRIETIIVFIDKADPSPTGRYAGWLFKMATTATGVIMSEDVETLHELLTEFDTKKHRLPREYRDVNRYQSPAQLSRALEEHFQESKRGQYLRLVGEGIEHIYGDEHDPGDLKVYRITTPEAAHRVGQGTRWCVKDEIHASGYLDRGELYYVNVSPEYQEAYPSIDYPVLAYTGDGVEIRDRHNDAPKSSADDEDERKALHDLTHALRTADRSLVCNAHNRLIMDECGQCQSTSMCESCAIECYDCPNQLCPKCAKECAVCENTPCDDCAYGCEVCQQRVCRDCLHICQACSNVHMCSECVKECAGCGDALCEKCVNGKECNDCKDPLCRKCQKYCPVCDQLVCDGCGYDCSGCGQRACDDCSNDDGYCTNCAGEEKDDDNDWY